MKKIRESGDDSILEAMKNNYPHYKLGSYENLVRLKNPDKISNKSQFYKDRSQELLNAINDINDTFYDFPDKQKLKIISSKHYQKLFYEIFLFLDQKTKSTKNEGKQNLEEFTLMMNLSEKFLKIGIEGIKKTMPEEFNEILETKIKDIMLQVQSITQLTKKLSPTKSNEVDYDYDYYTRGSIRTRY